MKTQEFILSPKEELFVNCLFKNTFPYKTWSALVDDCFTWFDYNDLSHVFSKSQYAGLISSLEEKGIVGDAGDCEKGKADLYITEEFVEFMANME